MLLQLRKSEFFSLEFVLAFLGYLRQAILPRNYTGKASLKGRTVLITGGSGGIGREAALQFAQRGAKVIITYRDERKANETVLYIRGKIPSAKVIAKYLDLASFSSIRKFADEILKSERYIHILINNAGLFTAKSETKDGFETNFGVIYLGHFLLTDLLKERIKASAPARIINVSSAAHYLGKLDFSDINCDRGFNPIQAYGRSKLCQILFTKELGRRLEGTNVSTYSLHPGGIDTDLPRDADSMNRFWAFLFSIFSKLLLKSPVQGTQTILYCALEESISNESGYYYSDCSKMSPSREARDEKTAMKLWDVSEKLISSQDKIHT